jgi:putative thiamine transport system ATP-binding protein
VSLVLEQICLRAGRRVLLRDWSLEIAAGEVAVLRGLSGIGKSSVLAFISGALPRGVVGSGRVRLHGVPLDALPAHRRGIGMLFQDDLLFPHMSVEENLLFGLHASVRGLAARRAAVAEGLRDIELPGTQARDPVTLSGGQRARVGLLRVLLSRPRALLLDEPFTGLDPALRSRLGALVVAQARARGLPSLWVTHDEPEIRGRVLCFPAADWAADGGGSLADRTEPD